MQRSWRTHHVTHATHEHQGQVLWSTAFLPADMDLYCHKYVSFRWGVATFDMWHDHAYSICPPLLIRTRLLFDFWDQGEAGLTLHPS